MADAFYKAMKTLHRFAAVGTCLLALALLPTGCATGANDRYTHSSKDNAVMHEKQFRFKATVVYHRDRGGYYTLASDSGESYYPENLERAYRKAGLRVQVYGQTHGYALGGEMRALKILEIGVLNPR
jgi:hypothetical protein